MIPEPKKDFSLAVLNVLIQKQKAILGDVLLLMFMYLLR